jgi:hypothetical protein
MLTEKYSILIVLVALTVYNQVGQPRLTQSTPAEITSVKIDEYGDLPTDDEAAHLDLFADRLFKQPKVRGQIIAYSEPQTERGYYLRRIYGIGKYLTDARGIEANRVAVVDAGYSERFTTELWLIPEGASPPSPISKLAQPTESISAYKFDEECLDCSPAVDLYLYGLDARGVMIVRPDHDVSVRTALNEARKAKRLLVKRHGISANRISIKSARARNDGTATVEMWVVPAGARMPDAWASR